MLFYSEDMGEAGMLEDGDYGGHTEEYLPHLQELRAEDGKAYYVTLLLTLSCAHYFIAVSVHLFIVLSVTLQYFSRRHLGLLMPPVKIMQLVNVIFKTLNANDGL